MKNLICGILASTVLATWSYASSAQDFIEVRNDNFQSYLVDFEGGTCIKEPADGYHYYYYLVITLKDGTLLRRMVGAPAYYDKTCAKIKAVSKKVGLDEGDIWWVDNLELIKRDQVSPSTGGGCYKTFLRIYNPEIVDGYYVWNSSDVRAIQEAVHCP